MDFLADVPVLEVFLHELGHQVAAVRGRVDQAVFRRGGDRAVEHHLQRLVAGLVGLEGQVIAVQDVAFGARVNQFDDVRQVGQVTLFDLDQAQAARGVLVQQRLDQRRLAGAPRARQQHIVGRQALDELPGVALDQRFLVVDAPQVAQVDAMHLVDRLQRPLPRLPAPAECDRRLPVHRRGRRRQQSFEPGKQRLGARHQIVPGCWRGRG